MGGTAVVPGMIMCPTGGMMVFIDITCTYVNIRETNGTCALSRE